MKHLYKYLFYSLLVLSTILFVQCEEDDNEKEWGLEKVYMPQASILDGGISNNYPVPLQNNPLTQNYVLDTVAKRLDITLGVYRSGLKRLEAYSVDVTTKPDTVNQMIADEIIKNAVLLPDDVYTLPETVSVLDGHREAIFNLSIDVQKLIDDYPQYGGQKLVVAVAIDNPSNYELNKALSTTIVIIDSREFMPAAPIKNYVEGGDMEGSSKDLWKWTSSNMTWGYADETPAGGEGGCLKWFGASSPEMGEIMYHPVKLEVGKEYHLSCMVKVPDGASGIWMHLNIADKDPNLGAWENEGDFIGIWSGDPVSGMNGDIRLVGNVGWGELGDGRVNALNGKFTATSTDMYVYLKCGMCCGGTFNGSVLVDEVKLVEAE